jgi:hypothetical protein
MNEVRYWMVKETAPKRSIMREAASLPIRISATPSPALSWNALAPKPGRLLVVLGLVCEPPLGPEDKPVFSVVLIYEGLAAGHSSFRTAAVKPI